MKKRKKILKKAKLNYPIGTIIYDKWNNMRFEVKKIEIYKPLSGSFGITGDETLCVIYFKGEWADIISLPIQQKNNKCNLFGIGETTIEFEPDKIKQTIPPFKEVDKTKVKIGNLVMPLDLFKRQIQAINERIDSINE